MTRAEAIATVVRHLTDELVVAANGFLSRETIQAKDRPENFYMIGSMGLAAPIGLGIALARPERRVVVFDGDGNLLMGLGILPQVAERAPRNFHHIVFDNAAYGSTGNQPTITERVALELIAKAAGYRSAERVCDLASLEAVLPTFFAADGPAFLLVRVTISSHDQDAPRVHHPPEAITERFRAAVGAAPPPPHYF
ncbi:MAG: thiamine pyrophosphate-dependent enzyme [Candidatus Methylomirabilales bacterium]